MHDRSLITRVSALVSPLQSSKHRDADEQGVGADFAHAYLRRAVLFSAPEAINPVTPGHLGEHGVFLINNLLSPQMDCMRGASRQTKRTAERPKTWHLCSVATVPIRTFAHLLRSSRRHLLF